MYIGISADGINRELSSTLECASLCREYHTSKSLAIPETALLKLASTLPQKIDEQSRERPLFDGPAMARLEWRPTYMEICRGILSSLRHVVNRECKTLDCHVEVDTCPDSCSDYFNRTVDPFGNDYFCKLCDQELSNTYFHCEGCETLLGKDFNICSQCLVENKFLQNKVMHQGKANRMATNFHHVGKTSTECKCRKSANKCSECKKCMFCSCCTCHTSFKKRFRFFTVDHQKQLLDHCKALVGDDEIRYARETENRLDRVVMVPSQRSSVQLPNEVEQERVTMAAGGGCQSDDDRKPAAIGTNGSTAKSCLPYQGSCIQDVEVVSGPRLGK